jgi:flagellar hook protein FlgE
MMRTGVSGMQAQANRLSTVSDNIANSSTTGYKRASTEFASLIIPSTPGNYSSGGVSTTIRNSISQQGDLRYTTSGSDLAIDGGGFFVVQAPGGAPSLTRAGSFVPDAEGRLVNSAGLQLMGYSYANGIPSAVANGFAGLEPVTLAQGDLSATASTLGTFTANLPSDAAIVPAAKLPSANAVTAEYSAKSSLVAYDNLGTEVILDVYFTKTGANTWEVAVYNQKDAAASTSFPYGAPALATQTLAFDGTNGKLTTASAKAIDIPIPGGQTLDLDLAKTTQLAMTYTVLDPDVNGNAPSQISGVEIKDDGTVYAQYENGAFKELYRIPIADVQSPDQLTVMSGNVFAPNSDTGALRIGFANEAGMGTVVSGALESSNVDVAQELTDMIESQRSYTANSKVFQTGADLMDILVNLKR